MAPEKALSSADHSARYLAKMMVAEMASSLVYLTAAASAFLMVVRMVDELAVEMVDGLVGKMGVLSGKRMAIATAGTKDMTKEKKLAGKLESTTMDAMWVNSSPWVVLVGMSRVISSGARMVFLRD